MDLFSNLALKSVGVGYVYWLFSLINYGSDMFNVVGNNVMDITDSFMNYITGKNDTWFFFKNYACPIPAAMYSDENVHDDLLWTYNTSGYALTYNDATCNQIKNMSLPWLSASIVDGSNTYMIDDFISRFTFSAPRECGPSPRLLLTAWSLHSKIWVFPSEDAEFHIIDEEGEVHIMPIFNRTEYEKDVWQDLVCGPTDVEDGANEEDSASEEDNTSEEDDVEEEDGEWDGGEGGEDEPTQSEGDAVSEEATQSEGGAVSEEETVTQSEGEVEATQSEGDAPSEEVSIA